ncbi:ribose-5-phosphate isomerase 2 [Pyrus ussuriensis x Pyrus communis]|uniref:Ribose-5-phosphate isomerase 2 n=1 Tax=Pyrus ussuriensis x Pyrus communis TaxID=2448454 RepID=A0A5N5GI83_9ROSA|nr:ribose-5-phosphate isomerase 2 [Pyrus ussuriensis x Pyrus communis]
MVKLKQRILISLSKPSDPETHIKSSARIGLCLPPRFHIHPSDQNHGRPTLRWRSTSSVLSIAESRTGCKSRSDNGIPRDGGVVNEKWVRLEVCNEMLSSLSSVIDRCSVLYGGKFRTVCSPSVLTKC